MAIIRGKYFTLTPTSKLDIFANPGKRLTLGADNNPITATGGSEADLTINNVTYKVHTFSSSGILTVTTAGAAEYLVVGGGGGGASGRQSTVDPPSNTTINQSGGGGGAGGLLTGILSLSVGTYNVVVGSGGNGGTYPSNSGSLGTPTKLILDDGASLIESFGGGGGGINAAGLSGGSGGGGGSNNSPQWPSSAIIANQPGGTGIVGQGNPGASGDAPSVLQQIGGGGGGAGGSSASTDGGQGLPLKFNSTASITYSSGGDGGSGDNGSANTGSGGGGGQSTGNGGAGGSGIVIIRYRI